MLRTKFKNENEQRAITPKVWNFELWCLCTALFLNKIYLPIKFHVDALHNFKVMLRTKFKYENEQRAITLKVWNFELWFLCTALFLNKIYLPIKFHVLTLHINFKFMLRTKFKYENEQRPITPKVWNFQVWFLCTALLNEIYLPMKLNVDALHSFKVMLRTKKGRTDGQTDWRTDGRTEESITICHHSGS